MDNNKKHHAGTANSKASSQPTDSNRQKSTASDAQTNKYWPRNSRRRENSSTSARNNNNNSDSKQHISKLRPNVDKRPRARGYNGNNHNAGSSYRGINEDYFATSTRLGFGNSTFYDSSLETEAGRFEHTEYEVNSVYAPGSKKQNLNHLLNFYYTPRDVDYNDGIGGNSGSNNGNSQRHGQLRRHKYNKEQFLQANFQFVIKASAKRKTDYSPDTLIDWALIEQINIQTSDDLQCPICLYPPVAGKITRCGHVYCWPCVLHYLSLSDKTWRKCPICYDAIHASDLKSAFILKQHIFNDNSYITFRLMRRKKDSLFIEKYDNKNTDQIMEKYPYYSSPVEDKLFSKFILAKRNDVAYILAREKKELENNDDKSCPEYVFIQQALELLEERLKKLGDIEQKDEENAQVIIFDNNELTEQTKQLPCSDINQAEELSNEASSIINQESKSEDTSESVYNNETATHNQSQPVKKLPNKFYYFYQSDDGQNIYLHPLNVKMLQACYGTLADAPSVITALIVQKEQHTMDEDHRRKFTCLGHLPLTCQFSVIEIELQPPYITEDIINAFKGDILFRKKERQRKIIEERKREKHINEINERQMGKFVASNAKLNITSPMEFPKCGVEESLVSPGGFDPTDNIPSTSDGCRAKTISTSSSGGGTYSEIAMHCKKEHTPWSTINATQITKHSTIKKTTAEESDTSILSTIHTNFADVFNEALSLKKEQSVINTNDAVNSKSKSCSNKKSKKSKKMLPLYSTGMNFSGN